MPTPKMVGATTAMLKDWPSVAVLIPCYNEEHSIQKVVGDFRACLPQATIYVYDNNSSDRTSGLARAAGAVVGSEVLQGKGHVVRRMFADIDADIYVLVDGDDTYDAQAAMDMICKLLDERLDMVTAIRAAEPGTNVFRPGHALGNRILTGLVRWIFGKRVNDVLSGYRAFSKRFVKSFPALATGFETEAEFTIHALELRMPITEIRTTYRSRAVGSVSKLRTFSDGIRVLSLIARLIKEERPFQFFSISGFILLMTGTALSIPVFAQFSRTGMVPRLPTAVLSTGIVLLAFLSFACGLILDSVARARMEIRRLAYLSLPPPRLNESDTHGRTEPLS
jgi:glycosyltransferase involved in cell wall biosynthesis